MSSLVRAEGVRDCGDGESSQVDDRFEIANETCQRLDVGYKEERILRGCSSV